MSIALLSACLWALAATLVAFLPMRAQMAPGLALLLAAPGLQGWIALEHGSFSAVLALAALVSMFRKPLASLLRRGRAHLVGRPRCPG